MIDHRTCEKHNCHSKLCHACSIEFVKECCLLWFKISTDILNRNIDATMQTFYRKCNDVRFDFMLRGEK